MSQIAVYKTSGGGGGGSVTSVAGGHDINITGTPTVNPTVNLNNAITLGDLASIVGTPALEAATGDITLDAGNINLPNTDITGDQGEIKFGGDRYISNYGTANFFAGQTAGNTTLNIGSAVANTALGYIALGVVTDGNSNTAIGAEALTSLNTGSINTAVGVSALNALSTGNSNVAIGGGTLQSLENSGGNVGVGNGSLQSSVSDSNNTGLGSSTLATLNGGSNNTAVGYHAGNQSDTGSNNIFIGYLAGQNLANADSNSIIIGSDGVVGDDNTIRIGTQGAGAGQQNLCFIAGITGVTTSNSNMVTIDTTTGQLGAATISSGGINTINGDVGSVTGSTVTFTGGTSGAVFTGVGTTMTESFNFLALPDTNAGGSIGYISFGGVVLLHNYVSSFEPSLFLGVNSGNFTNTGFNNTGIGWDTLSSVTNGNQNVAVGPSALHSLTTGTFNTTIGIAPGALLTSGSQNTLVGYNAGTNLRTGSENICIGESSGDSLTTSESSNILIGNSGVVADNNVIRIGTQGASAGEQNTCYVAGITGVTVSNQQTVVINTVTGQLGSHVMPGPSMGTYTGINHASSPYTVQPTDYYISCDVTGGVITVLLPNAPLTSTVFAIKDKVGLSATSNITVTTVGGAVNIDGATTFTMNTAYEAISVIFNGVSYEIF